MPAPTPSRQLAPVLARAREQGWVVNAMTQNRFKLTHAQAKKPLITPADTTAAKALRTLENEMKAALGPVQTMQTPKAGRYSKAALKAMSDEELRTSLQNAQASLADTTEELVTVTKALDAMAVELSMFHTARDLLRGIFGDQQAAASFRQRQQTEQPLRQAQVQARPAPADDGKPAASNAAAPSKKAAPRRAAAPAKTAGTGGGRRAAPAKRAASKQAPKQADPAQLDLEQAIESKKREASPDAGAGNLTTPAGVAITQDNAGELLRAHRAGRKETQVRAALALKSSVTTLINWENGNTKPQGSSLPRIAEYLRSSSPADQSSSSLAE